MKKQVIMKILLILLPILAVGLATTVDSVLVFDPQAGTMDYYSYFTPLDVEGFQVITPLAAILSAVSGLLTAVYMAAKKEWCLKGIVGVSFCAATLAVLPILFAADVKIVPNVGLPILMISHCLLAYFMVKKPAKEEAPKVRTLRK
ncbi:MAG: hypothetical protein U0L15_08935 [Oscillospiraceae bacterium]|nr:hypothetical protein [Oscillospiraceae bacterium]